MRAVGRIFFVGLLILLSVAAFAEDVTLKSLRSSYEDAVKRIDSQFVPDDILAKYAESLEALAGSLQKDGNLEGLLAVRKEKERFAAQKSVPKADDPSENTQVILAREGFRKSVEQARADVHRKVLQVTDIYLSNLETLKKQLTQQGKLADAMTARDEEGRVKASQRVTAAKFALAEMGVKMGEPEEAEPPPAEPVKYSVIKARKRVEAKGGFSADWTKTTMMVKRGDAVRISARGMWQCSGMKKECGPEGYPYARGGYYWGSVGSRTSAENYGALLFTIGDSGKMVCPSNSYEFVSADEGMLMLDANVQPGAEARKACSGSIEVEVEVKRPRSN